MTAREQRVLDTLRRTGASFFTPLHEAAGGGYPDETVRALWSLVWSGLITNDAFHALRSFVRPPERRRARQDPGALFRTRRLAPPSTEGRWAAVERQPPGRTTAWMTALTEQLLARYGVLTREATAVESVPGGFAALYPVLRALEDAGRIRRGYFVSGIAAAQFARPAAVDMLRGMRESGDTASAVVLAATDPANPYGHVLPWPSIDTAGCGSPAAFARTVGAMVALVNGSLTAFWRTGSTDVAIFMPDDEPDRTRAARALAAELVRVASAGTGRSGGLLIRTINGQPAEQHAAGRSLSEAGFSRSAMGYHVVRPRHEQ
jgi:ATP-dependent Lhr-like helicase